MSQDHQRAAFEVWWANRGLGTGTGKKAAWFAYQAGRAAIRSQPTHPEISRGLLGKIVDEVFDGAIEDASVIEDIYRVIARELAMPSQDREDAPWGDLKVAFGCDDDEALWKAVESEKIHFPKGWKLIETDGSCARVVAIFRVDRIPTVADGESVREAIDAAMEKQK